MAEPDQAAAGAPDGSNAKGKQPDMQEALDAELSALRKPHGKATELWHWERANVNGLVWVTLNSRRAQPTPSQVVQAAATEADKNKECMSRQAGAGPPGLIAGQLWWTAALPVALPNLGVVHLTVCKHCFVYSQRGFPRRDC